VAFAPGDRLAVYSDGVYEVRDPSGNEFGRDRLNGILTGGRAPIEEVVETVMQETSRHAGGRPPEDDLTLLVLESGRAPLTAAVTRPRA
jgi:sigma-B regulation protein RsbU (phosphoserine phosphatase)